MFELFEHTADLGIRLRASTLEELLADAGRGLLAVLVANPESVRPLHIKKIELPVEEPDMLLFDWLTELLFAFESDRLLISKVDINLSPTFLTATCHGEPMDPARHSMDHEVKAVTYHALRCQPTPTGWEAEVIVDI
jgi:SHS2 domain-containing protein